MIIPKGVADQRLVAEAVGSLQTKLFPSVTNVFYRIGQDWSNDWALFLGIVLSDKALRRGRLSALAESVTREATKFLHEQNLGLPVYFSFRSESEARSAHFERWL